MNFAKGILESRIQTYKHLGKLLKTIPLETPTTIELCPGQQIRVTLFDANHCTGAVMFLIEGHGKAILYTGDIRSETWWVNSLVQNPVLLPYTLGKHRLDRIYLDTTFATKSNLFREFPSKADALRELLETVEKYPPDTIFYFHAWTFGYENVWLALSNFLDSQIHLDKYRLRLYRSLAAKFVDAPPSHEAPALCGYYLGNHRHEGCLTSDMQARLNSCENGTICHVHNKDAKLVRIIPVVTRTKNGTVVPELGAGGGQGDLDQVHELEVNDQTALEQLVALCKEELSQEDPQLLKKILDLLSEASEKNQRISMGCDQSLLATDTLSNLPLQSVIKILANVVSKSEDRSSISTDGSNLSVAMDGVPLQTIIHFPYSRHSSYSELCTLVEAFKPKDIYPCTVDSLNWEPSRSMRDLFGSLCSSDIFAHDKEMLQQYDEGEERLELKRRRDEDSMQLMTSDLEDEEDAQDSNSAPPRKRSRSDGNDQDKTSPDEVFHSSQHATCDTQLRLDDLDESMPLGRINHHDNTPETQIYNPVRQNGTNTSTEAVKGTLSPQEYLSPRNPEPQTPPRIHVEASDPIRSSPPLYSSSPFSKAVPAPLFRPAHHATPSPRPSKILSTPQQVLEDKADSSNTHMEADLPPTSSPTKPLPPSSIPSSRGQRPALPLNLLTRKLANDATLEFKGFTWWDFGGLVSAGNNHSEKEMEL